MRICPNCKSENPNYALYCMECGSLLKEEDTKIICKICNHENPIDAEFCGKCGTPLKEDTFPVGLPNPSSGKTIKCSACGNLNRSNSKYCSRCGFKLEKEKAEHILETIRNNEDANRMHL